VSAAVVVVVVAVCVRSTAVRVGGVDLVEADQGVEVHNAAASILGDLAVGDPQPDVVGAPERS
jgi:hypothetical protein